MAKKTITNFPVGGIDTDSENRMVDSKDYRYALNIRNGIAYLKRTGGTTNVKGNEKIVKIVYPYTDVAPSGKNKCIGTYEDKQNATLIFFIQNSQGNDQIMRFYPDKKSTASPYGEVHQLCVYDFGWESWTKITSVDLVAGKLLYWCDNIKSRKLNIEKANLVEKQKSWTIHYPKTNQFTSVGFITFTYEQNGALHNIRIPINVKFDTTSDAINYITAELNTQLGSLFTFTGCNCKIEVVEKNTSVRNVLITGYGGVSVPENFYGYNFYERYVDLVKSPPLFNPTCNYRKDTTKNYNYVKDRVFQFRLQYVYDDNEKSALSPISQIASGNSLINIAQANSLNYIDVDFNNEDILDITNWVVVKWIRLFAIEHNTGKWCQIADLEPCEFYDLKNSLPYIHYKFYNDVVSQGVDDALASKLYDDVPIKNQCQKFVKNRMVLAGVTQNYNAPECVDATITQDFENSEEKVYDVTAKIRIVNPSYNGNANLNLSSIKQIKGAIVKNPAKDGFFDYPVFGGLPTQHDETNEFGSTFNTNQGEAYQQWLPEGGFVGYLAGTDYLGISVQTSVNANVTPSVIGTSKVFDASDIFVEKTWVGHKYNVPNEDGSALVQLMVDDNADIYSLLTIKNVPNGTYILRLASHWCSYPEAGETKDKLDKGTMYNLNNRRAIQKTSTNTFAVKDASGSLKMNEFELIVTVNNGDVYAGEFYVADQTNCYEFNVDSKIRPRDKNISGYRYSVGVTGYLYDNDGKYGEEDLKTAIAMEKQWITVNIKADLKNAAGTILSKNKLIFYSPFGGTLKAAGQTIVTDHNGYFNCVRRDDWTAVAFFQEFAPIIVYDAVGAETYSLVNLGITPKLAFGKDTANNDILIDSLTVFNSESVLKDITTGGLAQETITAVTQGFIGCSNSDMKQFFVPCVLPSASAQLKTYIYGKVVDTNGDGFSGITTLYSGTGRVGTTDNDGDWQIPIYAESIGVKTTPLTRDDYTIYILNGIEATFSANVVGDVINGIGTTYTTTNKYETIISPVNCTIITVLFGKDHKRGGNYIYALRYYDYGGRLCSVVTAPDLNIYIPFITEDLGKYLPNQYATGTYKTGRVSLNWQLNSDPPVWASTYQWMRTKDNHYSKYLSWVINSVKYVSKIYQDEDNPETETSYGNGDATNIMLDISNISDYKRRNPSSLVSYEFEEGDKVRLIRDQDGTYLQGLIEYDVVAYQTTGSYLILKNDIGAPEIKAGSQIEVYNVRKLNDEKGQLFYEVGETFACTAPNETYNRHSVTNSTFTNGDSYWLKREILVNDDATNYTGTFNYLFESSSISDFYLSKDSDIGRIGSINKDFVRQFRPTLMVLSNVFIPDTQVNGLSSFEALNTKELDRNYGLIERLMYGGDTLFAVCQNRIVSNYIGERVIAEARDNTGVIAIADDFFGTDRAQLNEYGTQNGESVIQQDNNIYGIDVYRGLVWRHAQNGTVEISAIGNRADFKEAFKNGIFEMSAGMDRFYSEYIITYFKPIIMEAIKGSKTTYNTMTIEFLALPSVQVGDTIEVTFYDPNAQQTVKYKTDIISISGNNIVVGLPNEYISDRGQTFTTIKINYKGEGDTFSWCEEKNKWNTHYSYQAEMYGIVGMNFMAFLNGQAWIQDKNEIRNNFFGVQYTSKITPVFVGEDASAKKVWEVAKLEQWQTDQKCDWSAPIIENDYNQLSRLTKTFVKKEEHWYNPFKRDLSDVTVPLATRILNGRMLRSSNITVGYENDSTKEFTLRSMVAEYIDSLRN